MYQLLLLLAWAVDEPPPVVELTDEVFLANEEAQRVWPSVLGPLQGACVTRDASSPSYRLFYGAEAVCAWRPWRVGTYLVEGGEECACGGSAL